MADLFEWKSGTLPAVTGSTVSLDASEGFPDAPSILISQDAGQQAYVTGAASAASVAARAYIKTPAAWGTSAAGIMAVGAADATECRMYWGGTGSPGQIRLQMSATSVLNSATGIISLSTVYRFELQVDSPNSRARIGVFPAVGTSELWNSDWQTHANFAVAPTRINVGRKGTTPTLGAFKIDSIKATDSVAGWIGEDTGAPVAGKSIFIKNASGVLVPAHAFRKEASGALIPVHVL